MSKIAMRPIAELSPLDLTGCGGSEMLMTYAEAAALLRRSPATLRKDVMLHRIPVVKMFGPRGKVLFEREALERLIEASRVEPAPAEKLCATSVPAKR